MGGGTCSRPEPLQMCLQAFFGRTQSAGGDRGTGMRCPGGQSFSLGYVSASVRLSKVPGELFP